jgi:hypothetical protein
MKALKATRECSITTKINEGDGRDTAETGGGGGEAQGKASLFVNWQGHNVIHGDANTDIRADYFTNPVAFIKFENCPFVTKWNANETALEKNYELFVRGREFGWSKHRSIKTRLGVPI